MKKIILLALVLWASGNMLFAQKYLTRTGQISFTASTPLETINPVNNESATILDGATGDVIVETLIKGFKFKITLMQEHFNEEYMESDKFPKASFRGKITDINKVDFAKDGTYQVHVNGKLTMHGVTRDISIPANIKVTGNDITVTSTFSVAPEDYQISIPSLVRNKIAKTVQISMNALLHKR
ncbi:YceI family protein [Taibaiella lutea]|uniref:YceI family protein n=1 Tax=Taibaiella lutea TaxID=2608001 RepID=A0A5M6CLH3_9BACT|nr:YceI family protein [Taibaiella lutea]KAA5534842.1 YceI family protein [Taibaiella lutea]